MPRGKSDSDLRQEWCGIAKNWYSIYQWSSVNTAKYSESIATLILEVFPNIELTTLGLRQTSFRVGDHRGQAKLQTNIAQFTEKRFCRALFNASSETVLGEILDYEVPLKAVQGAKHGDIDLVARIDEGLSLIEAKQPKSSESILKAMLQVYTYSMLVSSVKRQFSMEYGMIENTPLIPVILTFKQAKSAKQLSELKHGSIIVKLLEVLNSELSKNGVQPISFYIITDDMYILEKCLTTRDSIPGDKLVVFVGNYLPRIEMIEL